MYGPVEDYPRTVSEFERRFATAEACRAYLVQLRWPDGFRCPKCGAGKAWPVGTLLECVACGRQTSVTAGTIFQGTRTPLPTWFRAMWWVPNATADSLQAFVQEAVAPGSLLHTDGLLSYDRLEKYGYRHRITFVKGRKESASELLPRVHQVISLLKRWLLGTHQGAVSRAHLDYYLDEFTFRFNRRTARHRGKLFYRLVQQAVAIEPAPYASLVKHVRSDRRRRRRHKI